MLRLEVVCANPWEYARLEMFFAFLCMTHVQLDHSSNALSVF